LFLAFLLAIFAAVGLRMNARTANIVAKQMRVDLCTYLRTHRTRLEEFCVGGLEKYITAMKKPGCFGDHLEARILSEMSNSRLHVLKTVLHEDGLCVVNDDDIMAEYGMDGCILYISFFQHMFREHHYMATVSEDFQMRKRSSRSNPEELPELSVAEALDKYRELFNL
jgi:hypothetical protein